MANAFFSDLLATISDRGRTLLRRGDSDDTKHDADGLIELCGALLSGRGEASGTAMAREVLDIYQELDAAGRRAFFEALVRDFGPDRERLSKAIEKWRAKPSDEDASSLHFASEPRRQELIRRLNRAPGGTGDLVNMRADLLGMMNGHTDLAALDRDATHLLSSWFNRGFLVLRRIDWSTPAAILEKIIKYEAVHAIQDWDDLRNRLEPADRRCYAFFHPQLIDEPLIFVEVALTKEIPGSIGPLLDKSRQAIVAHEATTAVFYSISNTQKGLAGVTFGNFLIKQVVQDLARELPNLKTFVTLSPVPGFAGWVKRELKAEASVAIDEETRRVLSVLDDGGDIEQAREVITSLGAYYFLKAKLQSGKPLDPVARFHLGNGARLERLNFLGDGSGNGMKQSYGLMVNYLYALEHIEANHEAFAEHGTVVASDKVKKALRAGMSSRDLVPSPKANPQRNISS